MDNRLTRKRLSDLLSYEWIFMIIVCIVSIVLWELIYSIGSVKLTAGQRFTYFYDYTVNSADNSGFRSELLDKEPFSYDVLKISSESIMKDNNVLTSRLSIQEGDVIFTDVVGIEEYRLAVEKKETPTKKVRAFSMIDNIGDVDYSIGSIDVLLDSAKEYLKDNFFVDNYNETTDGYGAQNIDDAKVKKVFLKRNGKDNRFRTQNAKNKGVELEKERIVKLCENVEFMLDFIAEPSNSDALLRYTKFSQSHAFTGWGENNYKAWIEIEEAQGRDNDIYGINLGKLTGGKKSITDFVQFKDDGTKTDVVILYFDFSSYQPHLQYETLSFICSTMKIFMGIQ